MKKWSMCLLALVLLLSLAACRQESVVIPEPAPAPEPVVTPEPEPVRPLPEADPEPIPEPKPEPEPELVYGDPVTVNGSLLASGSVRIGDQTCISLEEASAALGEVLTWDDDLEAVLRNGQPLSAKPAAPVVEARGMHWVPLEFLASLDLGYFYDEPYRHHYFTAGAVKTRIPEGVKVPILMYHAVSDDLWSDLTNLFVSPADMEAQLQYLQDNGYTTIFFSDLERADQIQKPLILTVDDGYLDNYEELFPLLQKYNAKATIFAITQSIGTHPLYFTWEQAREMADSGLVEIQSHTRSHPQLDTLTREAQQTELEQSQLDIVRNLGREPYVVSYPQGRTNEDTMELVKQYYNFAVKTVRDDYITGEDAYAMDRWGVDREMSLDTFRGFVE